MYITPQLPNNQTWPSSLHPTLDIKTQFSSPHSARNKTLYPHTGYHITVLLTPTLPTHPARQMSRARTR